MYERILLPTDGSRCSQIAVQQGVELAQKLGASVTFLYALEDPVTTSYAFLETAPYQPELYAALRSDAETILARALAQAQDAQIEAETVLAERQDPVSAILELGKEHDLIVMGTHGRRGMDRLMFGSVAEGVLRRATRPCLMIRETGTKRADG